MLQTKVNVQISNRAEEPKHFTLPSVERQPDASTPVKRCPVVDAEQELAHELIPVRRRPAQFLHECLDDTAKQSLDQNPEQEKAVDVRATLPKGAK